MSRSARVVRQPRDALGYLLKHAHQQLTAIADAALAAFDIDSKDLGVLRVLVGHEPVSQQQVATMLGVDRTTMVALLDTLEAKGIVTRRPDPDDRRRNVVAPTQPGLALIRRADAAYVAAEDDFLSGLSGKDAAAFRRVLAELVAP